MFGVLWGIEEFMRILHYPHPALLKKARPVGEIDDDVKKTATAMLEAMRKAQGIGLAGPQVDYPFRLITLALSQDPKEDIALINPEIIEESGEETADEGCLSFPGVVCKVSRNTKVRAQAFNLDGRRVELTCEGLIARAVQHEVDHLDGIVFIKRLKPGEKIAHAPQIKELERKAADGEGHSS
jgi:peptide deformylase